MVKHKGGTDKSQTWLTFLRNHLEVSWAMDFFTVPTVRFQILYIFVILNHSRRQVVHFAVTAHPTMDWVIQQLRERCLLVNSPAICSVTTTESTETRWAGTRPEGALDHQEPAQRFGERHPAPSSACP